MTTYDSHRETLITRQLQALSLHDKVRLLTGAGPWTLHAAESIGLRPLVVSDGPVGVRGATESESETGASFPSPTALAATWDEDLARRLGELFASEADRHGVDVVLAPVVNLQRTPVGGRHFECFSEDPLLTGRLASTLVSTMQEKGIGACVKHFVANDSETARTEYLARMDERTLREVYLAPFEMLVRQAGSWTIMAAYNGLDVGGEANSATEHRWLLEDLLKSEWEFDGVTISDWTAAETTNATANAGLDLVMPGPGGPWEDSLLKAVQYGDVAESTIDDKVRRILRLAHRRGAIEGATPPPRNAPQDASSLLREVSARSTVVIKDDNRQLPANRDDITSVALIGPNAVDTFLQGGGSCFVRPDHVITPAHGLQAALGDDVTVSVHRGGYSRPHLPRLDPDRVRQPDTDEAGIRIEYFDEQDNRVGQWRAADFNGWVRHNVPRGAHVAILSTKIWLPESGTHWLGLGTVGKHRVWIDGKLASSHDTPVDGGDVVINSSVNDPESTDVAVEVTTARHIELRAELQVLDAYGWGQFVRAALRHQVSGPDTDTEIAQAVEAARGADLAVVVVGTNSEVESEGWDRTTLALPGRQDELVRKVSQANGNTVVFVNAGAPVLLPWLDEVRCVLWNWFPGQECGHAMADVLFGTTEPAGRLPWTLPRRGADVPVPHAIPQEGYVDYHEGIHIGYRSYLRDDITPAVPFGHGLGWTDWHYHHATAELDGEGGRVSVTVENQGPRAGHEVVQVYLSSASGPQRPVRWLAGFAVATAEAGQTITAEVHIAPRTFAVWDTAGQAWQIPPGEYKLHIGRSIADIRLTDVLSLDASSLSSLARSDVMKRRTAFKLLGGAATTAVVGAGCSAPNAAGQILTVGMPNGPLTENNNPFSPGAASYSLGYRWVIYEPLAQANLLKPDSEPTAWLASDWEWTDDYTAVTITVRDKVDWSDGKPLTAEDVAFTFELMKEHEGLNIAAVGYKDIDVADNTVNISFDSPQFVNQARLLGTVPIVPRHLWEKIDDPVEDTVTEPVGTGPFTLSKWTAEVVTLQPNNQYWGGQPQVPEMRYTSYNDNNAQTTALGNGECQWSYVFIPNYKKVYVNKDPDHHKLWFPSGLGIHALFLNHTRKPFDNVALRKAMNLAIDRQAIHEQAEAGLYPLVDSPTGLPRPAGDDFIADKHADTAHEVDIDEAKKILDEAGFSLDGDVLKDPDGGEVTMQLVDPAGWSDYLAALQIIADNLAKIGIDASVDTLTFDAWNEAMATGDFDASLHWTETGGTPWDMYSSMMDGAKLRDIGENASENFGRYDNKDATEALAAYADSTSDADRTTALNTLQDVMVEEIPAIPLVAGPIGAEYSTKVWSGWPHQDDQYAMPQPTQPSASQIVMELRPTAG